MGMEIVALVMGFEEEFDLEIPDRDVEPLMTVGLMYDYLLERLDHAERLRLPGDPIEKPAEWTPESVWQRLREIIAQQLEIPIERIAAETHFIDDLDCG